MKAVIKEIGSHAFDGTEKMIILFGETATEALKEYSVIQGFEEKAPLELTVGDLIRIDEQEYTITEVGPFANSNLNSISHSTLVFEAAPEEDVIVNGLYLEPYELPQIEVGSIIEYVVHGA